MRTLTALFMLVLLLPNDSITFADTIIYVVRHTEKLPGDDPGLTTTGKQRALDLARALRSAKIARCYTSEFKRTRQTTEPTLRTARAKLFTYAAGKENRLVNSIKQLQNENILIVAHSNTIPVIVSLLTGTKVEPISESDYDNLFVVRLRESAQPTLLHLHYGGANPKERQGLKR